MFGYATDETEECMPLTIVLAHKLNAKMAELRRNGTLPWLRPDSKTQVRRGNRGSTSTQSNLLYSQDETLLMQVFFTSWNRFCF